MKLKRLMTAAIVCALLSGSAWSADLKIGYIDLERLLEESPQAQNATARLKSEFEGKEQALLQTQGDVKRIEDKLKKDADVMGESERAGLERELLSASRNLKRARDEFREDVNLRKNEERGKLIAAVRKIVEYIGKEDKYDLILYVDVLAYGEKKLDVTDRVLKALSDDTRKTGEAKKP